MKIGEIEKVGERLPDVAVPVFDPSRRDEPAPKAPEPIPAQAPAKREKEDA